MPTAVDAWESLAAGKKCHCMLPKVLVDLILSVNVMEARTDRSTACNNCFCVSKNRGAEVGERKF